MKRIWSGGVSSAEGPDLSNLMTREDNLVDQNLVDYEILGLLAYHLELAKSKVLKPEDSEKIIHALLELRTSGLKMDQDHEDVHSLVEDRVNSITEAGSNLRVFLSRNDQSHYDIRSFYMDQLLEISLRLKELSNILHEKFSEIGGYMPGYTHYRQAMPVALATYFDHLAAVFLEFSADSLSLYTKLSKYCPLGYGSGYGTAVKVDQDSLAKSLGFNEAYSNPVLGASYRGFDEVDIATLESKLMAFISRMAQDFILFSSDEFGFLKLPDGFTTGSSLMPNKRNPDFLEMLEGYASESLGLITTTISVLMNKGLGYHREFQLSKDKVMTFTLRIGEILDAISQMLPDMNVDIEEASKMVENSTNATMEAYSQFSTGVPWKEAYRAVGATLKNGVKLNVHQPEPALSVSKSKVEVLQKEIQDIILKRKELSAAIISAAEQFSSK